MRGWAGLVILPLRTADEGIIADRCDGFPFHVTGATRLNLRICDDHRNPPARYNAIFKRASRATRFCYAAIMGSTTRGATGAIFSVLVTSLEPTVQPGAARFSIKIESPNWVRARLRSHGL